MTAPIDIRPCDLRIVREILYNVLPAEAKVWVFGSRAKWTTKDASDLDLAIDAGRPLTRAESNNLADAFEESDLPYKVDVVDMYAVSDTFRPYIEKERVELEWGKNGWGKVKLGDYALKIGSGATPKGGKEVYLDNGEIFFIRSQNIYNNKFEKSGIVYLTDKHANELSNVEVQSKDILLNITGDSVARVCQVPDGVLPARVNQHVCIIRTNPEKLDPTFTRYVLVSNNMQSKMLSLASSGATRQALTKSMIENLCFSIPPLLEQKAIAEILGALDDKIVLNRRMCKTLESMAQALFKSWFVDFDPVRAKMREEQPYGMDAPTAALFPDKLVESELGLIPEGWKIRSLDQIADFLNGLALQKYPAKGIGFLPVIKIAQIRQGSCASADKASEEIPAEYIIDDGDVIFSWSGSLMQVLWTGGKGALNQHLFKVTSNTYPKWFYYFWIQHHMPWFQSVAESKATTMGHIQRKHLAQAKVLVPSFIFEKENRLPFSKIFAKFTQSKIENKKLEQTRDYLLPRLVSGEVVIKND